MQKTLQQLLTHAREFCVGIKQRTRLRCGAPSKSGQHPSGRKMKRWSHHLWADLTGPHAYRTWIVILTTVVAAYFSVYAVMESRHDRQMSRAMFERNTFITMVSSGNRGTFIAAMKNFGPIQTMSVSRSPPIFPPCMWSGTETPNSKPLWRWALHRLALCTARECGLIDSEGNEVFTIDLLSSDLSNADLQKVWLINSRLMNADLRNADMRSALLVGSNLNYGDLRHADLRDADLQGVTLNGADLRDADLRNADMARVIFRDPDRRYTEPGIDIIVHGDSAKLQGANLKTAQNLTLEQLRVAYWDEKTVWPDGLKAPCPRNLPDAPCDAGE